MRDDILKFIKGGMIALRNLVQRLKSGAEHEYRRTFQMIFDDFPTFTDTVADTTFGASTGCSVEKQTSPID